LSKTPYELLVGRKPNISYFRVFGCKCYILRKETRLSKFQSKCDEGFLLGYSSCSKAYRVYNKTHGIVEETYNVKFDETNGSQDQINLKDLREEDIEDAIKNLTIGDVRPREEGDEEGLNYSARATPSSSTMNDQAQVTNESNVVDASQAQDQAAQNISPSTSTQEPSDQPRIHHGITRYHPIDQVVGDFNKGVQIRSRIASFCGHFSFVSSIEPNRVDEALLDPDWVNAMHEELNNFTRN
jgi:hypothetical protein